MAHLMATGLIILSPAWLGEVGRRVRASSPQCGKAAGVGDRGAGSARAAKSRGAWLAGSPRAWGPLARGSAPTGGNTLPSVRVNKIQIVKLNKVNA